MKRILECPKCHSRKNFATLAICKVVVSSEQVTEGAAMIDPVSRKQNCSCEECDYLGKFEEFLTTVQGE